MVPLAASSLAAEPGEFSDVKTFPLGIHAATQSDNGDSSSLAQYTPDNTQSAPAMTENRPLTIGLLFPPDDSPLMSPAQIVRNGLVAGAKLSKTPVNVLVIEGGAGVSLDDQIQAGVMAGADVLVGPLQRDRVEELASKTSLPIPIVALNSSENITTAPSQLLMLSLSVDNEARFIAALAIKALAPADNQAAPQKIAVIKTDNAWDTHLSKAFEESLDAAGVPYEEISVDLNDLRNQSKLFSTELDPAVERDFLNRIAVLKKQEPSAAVKKQLRSLQNELAVQRATATPEYQSALLAMDAQAAALIRNRLPFKTRVWATSSTNPGDPADSSIASSYAYDLNGLVFSECPMIARYDARHFEARFQTSMPYTPAAQRLFALGLDALSVAQQWAHKQPHFVINGQTGVLTIDRDRSSEIRREPATVLIRSGALLEEPPSLLARPGDINEMQLPEPPKPEPLPEELQTDTTLMPQDNETPEVPALPANRTTL